jgi:leucyl-tRNA synthetase
MWRPGADPDLLVEDTVTMVVQVKGKVRDRIEVPADADEVQCERLALASEKVQALLGGATPSKVIVRAPKLVNIVP